MRNTLRAKERQNGDLVTYSFNQDYFVGRVVKPYGAGELQYIVVPVGDDRISHIVPAICLGDPNDLERLAAE